MPVTSSYDVYVDTQIDIQILYWFWFLENIYTILSYQNNTRCKLLHKCMVVMKEERSWCPHINTRNRSWDCTALAKHRPSIREVLCLTFSIARVIIIPKDGKKNTKDVMSHGRCLESQDGLQRDTKILNRSLDSAVWQWNLATYPLLSRALYLANSNTLMRTLSLQHQIAHSVSQDTKPSTVGHSPCLCIWLDLNVLALASLVMI